MFQAQADKSRQLLTTTFCGHVSGEELSAHIEELRKMVEAMQPGFRILADLSTMEAIDGSCVPFIQQIMDLCNAKGVKEVARVIPDPRKDIGFNVMSRFHYDPKVRFTTYESLEDALRSLTAMPD